MARYHYQRVLIKFRASTPGQWSELHWCDIAQDSEHNQIQIKVAPANDLNMPADHEFAPLSAEQTKKLLVVDVSTEERSLYCLVCTNTTLCRFDFNRFGEQYMGFGKYWSLLNDDYANQPDLALRAAFSADQIAADQRLQMRAQPLIDYQVLQAISSNSIKRLQEQYQSRQKNLQQEDFIRDAMVAEERAHREATQAILKEWLNVHRHVSVVISMLDIESTLDEVNRALLIHPVCETLAALKSNTQSVDEYENALLSILQRSEQTADVSDASKFAVQSFRDRFLGNSRDLNELFSENHNAPLMSEVYHFVLDVVFEELKIHRPDYQYMTSSDYKQVCPHSYTTQRLGQVTVPGAGERLMGHTSINALRGGPEVEYTLGYVPPPHRPCDNMRLFHSPWVEDTLGVFPRQNRFRQTLRNNAPLQCPLPLKELGLLFAVAGSVFGALAIHLFLTGGSLWLIVGALACAYSLCKVSSNIFFLLRENQPQVRAPIAVDQVPLSRVLDLRPW